MKLLSVRQPWANLIAMGHKSIETRSWPTKYRGPLAIHAGKKTIDDDGLDLLFAVGVGFSEALIATSKTHGVPLGAIVATCVLDDCLPIGPEAGGCMWQNGNRLPLPTGCELKCGDFTPGRFAWILKDVKAINPIPWKGALGLPDVPDELFQVKT